MHQKFVEKYMWKICGKSGKYAGYAGKYAGYAGKYAGNAGFGQKGQNMRDMC